MTVAELCAKLSITPITGELDADFDGVYAGDFLSRAMSHVEAGNLWLTIMNNANVIAVASLCDAAAVILAEDVALQQDALEAAEKNGITVLSSSASVYELCIAIHDAVSTS